MIIVAGTTYRTGTTLIQRLINTSEEALIYGEDNCILSMIYSHFEKSVITSAARSKEQKEIFKINKNSFTANMLPEMNDIFYSYYCFISQMFSRGDGFKTLSPQYKEIKFLKDIIGNLKIVLMYRNLQDSWNSYKNIYNFISRETFFNYYMRSNTLLKKSLSGDLPFVYPLRYENINKEKIENLFDWLGISNKSNIDSVLNLKLREMCDNNLKNGNIQ